MGVCQNVIVRSGLAIALTATVLALRRARPRVEAEQRLPLPPHLASPVMVAVVELALASAQSCVHTPAWTTPATGSSTTSGCRASRILSDP